MKLKALIFFFTIISLSTAYADDQKFKVIKNPNNSKIEQQFFLTTEEDFAEETVLGGFFLKDSYAKKSLLKKKERFFWFSKHLAAAITDQAILNTIIKQIKNDGLIVNEKKAVMAQLTGQGGLLLTADKIVVGGYLEPVRPFKKSNLAQSEKYLGYLNKNCFLIIKNETEEKTLTPSVAGEYSTQLEYVNFDYGPNPEALNIPRPLVTKTGNIIGWGRDNGYVYDQQGNMIGIGPKCETVKITIPPNP